MSLPATSPKAVFRACVVNAVRGGEGVMQKLIATTREAVTEEEAHERNPRQRNWLSDSLTALNKHEAAMVKGFPMALLEIFAEGPGTAAPAKNQVVPDSGMDFGELTLVDDNEMLHHIELSKAQQLAVHATDAVLAELNTLVSSAQGLRSVQPERNPMRPESYIRALQRVVDEAGVESEIRQIWMRHMRERLGVLLVEEYKTAAQSLRDHGIQPVGYMVAGSAGSSRHGGLNTGGYGSGYGGYGASGHHSGGYGSSMAAPLSGYGHSTYGRGWAGESQQAPLAAEAEEALLTVNILRQMLSGGDPFAAVVPGAMVAVPQGGRGQHMPSSGHAVPSGHYVSGHGPMSMSGGYVSQAAAEAMDDIAQLERLVGRLSGANASAAGPVSGWRSPMPTMPPRVYTNVPVAAGAESPAMAVEVVSRMMENIAQDQRLLPPVQRAVQNLEPVLQRLVRHDQSFFDKAEHPARRMLDEMTQRSLAFDSESALGFSQFMRLMDEAVAHLSRIDIKNAAPFENVLKALLSAWDTQERKLEKLKSRQEAKEHAKRLAEQREMLASKTAEDIRRLPGLGNVPAEVMDFAAGPWSQVIALAMVSRPEGSTEEDPGGYLALVPELLWSAQPDLTRSEPERLTEIIPQLLSKLREGLQTIQYPAEQAGAFIERLVSLHQTAFEAPVSASALAVLQSPLDEPAPMSSEDMALLAQAEGGMDSVDPDILLDPHSLDEGDVETREDPMAGFKIGVWVDLTTHQRTVRTQLTWASPQGTLFLFTGADGSTQSMTRRVRDKLAAEGALRLVAQSSSGSSSRSARHIS